jgi:limonene-1,2-epoxide hydrolase
VATQTDHNATATSDARAATERENQIVAFFAQWGSSFDAFCGSFQELLTEDCIWDQRPIPRLTGPRQAVRFLRVCRNTLGLATIDVEIHRIATQGNVVHVERVDRLLRADGSLIASAPVAGVLQFSGDRVVHWREYYDSAEFLAHALGTSVLYLTRRLAALTRRVLRPSPTRGHPTH